MLFGLSLVFVWPGYALSAALFPPGTFKPVERLLVTLGLSLVTSVLSALILNVASSGLQPTSWAVVLDLITLPALLAAGYRESATPWTHDVRAGLTALRKLGYRP